MLKWKRVDHDNTQETTLASGRKFRVCKFYDAWRGCEHHREWMVEEYNQERDEWEWCETYSPMWYAKQQVLEIAEYEQSQEQHRQQWSDDVKKELGL